MKAIQILKNIHEFEHLSAYAEFINHETIWKFHRLHFESFYYKGKAMNPNYCYLSVDSIHKYTALERVYGLPVAEYGWDDTTYYLYEVEP